ncbi:MAG: hydrogenase maturation protease [Vicinamibacteria bacterium]
MRTLLLGMGNPFLSDDAVGVRLARELKPRLTAHPDLDVVEECSVGGLNLLDVLRGYERAIVLDSLQTVGGVAGAWHYFDAGALRETAHLTSLHDANFATALELGRRLGMPLPESNDVHIFAVEVEDNVTFSERMSTTLERAFPVYSGAILERVRALLGREERPREGSSRRRLPEISVVNDPG